MSLIKKKKELEELFNKIISEHELEELNFDWGDAYASYSSFNYRLKIVRMSQIILKQITYDEAVLHLLKSLYKAYKRINGYPSSNPIRDIYKKKLKELSEIKKTSLMTRYEAVCPNCGHIYTANRYRENIYSCGRCDAPREDSSLVFKRVN